MKLLLFNQNLSPRLVELLADIYPGSLHVSRIELPDAPIATLSDTPHTGILTLF